MSGATAAPAQLEVLQQAMEKKQPPFQKDSGAELAEPSSPQMPAPICCDE